DRAALFPGRLGSSDVRPERTCPGRDLQCRPPPGEPAAGAAGQFLVVWRPTAGRTAGANAAVPSRGRKKGPAPALQVSGPHAVVRCAFGVCRPGEHAQALPSFSAPGPEPGQSI